MKKVLTVVLSLAVLFSFAACENKVPTLYGAKVLSVTPVSSLDYITGETVNPADIQFRIVYDSKAEATLSGAEIGMVPAEDNKNGYSVVNAGENPINKFIVTYGVDEKGAAQKWTVNVIGHYAQSLIVDPTNAVTAVLMNDAHKVSTTGLTYTAVFEGGTKAIDSTLGESKLGNSTFTYPSTASADDEVKVTWTKGTSGVESVKISPDWTVTLTDEDPSKTVDGVVLVQKADNEVFDIDGTGVTANTLSAVAYDVYLKYADGHVDYTKPVTKGTSVGNYAIDFPRYADTYKLSNGVTAFPAKVTIQGASDDEDKVYNATLNVTITEDYVKTFSVETKTGAYTLPGDKINPDNFTFKGLTYGSGKTDYVDTTLLSNDFKVTPEYVKIGHEGNVITNLSFTYNKRPSATTTSNPSLSTVAPTA